MRRDEDIMTIAEVAVLLGVSTRTVERLTANGQLGYTKVGRKTYCSRKDIDEFMHRQTTKPGKTRAS